ncbi:hypothetical protein G7Y89_g1821 [Cudoniella acicularis]|uniref:Rrn9 domain-containing protein n=1 Tax=Cudoniella acicularis TaxID=354080 RepID=A0A8H4RWB8_9HELO|nr:hypothetical protein G7Y89_g1821 [Cudoniella acicularis]
MEDNSPEPGSEYAPSEEPETSRPNRWTGAPSTWQSLTAQERGLAASLDELRNRDLSVHLYNAHALKKRAARLQSKASQGIKLLILEIKVENPIEEDADEPFVPPKSWTAWPLPLDEVPREGEPFDEDEPEEGYTFKRREVERPSRELEEILTGLSLKFAKETFEEREWASGDEQDIEDMEDVEGTQMENGNNDGEEELDERDAELPRKDQSEVPLIRNFLKPVVSADDERARELLQPTVRHTISKLDEVLMALHHARKTCRRYSSLSEPDTEDERQIVYPIQGSSEAENSLAGNPRRFENLTHRAKPNGNEDDENIDEQDILRPKKPGRGRKPKQYLRFDGETERDYHVRVARLQKKPAPAFAFSEKSKSLEKPRSRSRATPTPRRNRVPSEEAAESHQKRLGLRDWSEVLGSAALVGFPPDVIERVTQRCANLFGEGISMRTMVEAPFSNENADVLKIYQPEEIPDLGPESDSSASASKDSVQESSKKVKWMKPLGYAPQNEVCFCPVKDCPRQHRGFSNRRRLILHLERAHRLTKKEIAEFEIPSDEEMDGAVHVDGFLRPEKRHWGGIQSEQGKRRRVEDEGGLSGLESENSRESGDDHEQDETQSEEAENP